MEPKVDHAERVLPKNGIPGLVELVSNATVYVAEVNPENSGDDITPTDCGSTAEVAEKFKPSMSFQVKKLENLGAESVDEVSDTITMHYGTQPKEIMNDFQPENIAVKGKTKEGQRVLLDQQLTYLALEDLQERLKDQKFTQLFESNREGIILSIEDEIKRVEALLSDIELESMTDGND